MAPLQTPQEGFVIGWLRFWGAFARPWVEVLGFAVAAGVSTLLVDTVRAIIELVIYGR